MGTPQAGGAAPSGGDMLMQFVPLILMFAIFWFLLIRPQQKRAKAHKQMLAELKRGDHVMTSSGLIGRIMEISEEEVVIECGDAKLRMSRGAIGGLIGKSAEKAEAKAEETFRSCFGIGNGCGSGVILSAGGRRAVSGGSGSGRPPLSVFTDISIKCGRYPK